MDTSIGSATDSSLLALRLINIHKFYGTGRGAYHALRGLNLKVAHGTIYALLGASGCGKTTLLRCSLGRLPIQAGEIIILGKPPGAKGHVVPGKGVGYMPQEEALAPEFTMKEMMYFFGMIYGMNMKYIKARLEFLKTFLEIPTENRICSKLSGGQKRRVSLATALLHEPPLLILDEPTVGVGALLRSKVWSHLLDITSSGNTTIIITTHYIEEARQAHMVGMMRDGRMLAQDKPDDLIRAYNVVTLEDVFLKLAENQELEMNKKVSKGASIQQVEDEEPTEDTPLLAKANTVNPPNMFSDIQLGIPRLPKMFNTFALTWKEVLKFVRQPLVFFFTLINPTLQLLLLSIAYGQEINDVKIYYTAEDMPYRSDFLGNQVFHLGPSFLSHVDDDAIDLKLASSRDEGIEKIEDGRAWGYFNIPANFSENYVKRLELVCRGVEMGQPVNPSAFSGAAVELVMDVTSQQIYFRVNDTLNEAARLMRADFLKNTSIPEFYFDPLFDVTDYVYGGENLKIKDYTASGLITGMALGVSISLTSLNLILERKGGLFDRSWVAGVNVLEVISSQMLTFGIIALIQAILLSLSAIYVVDVLRKGSIALVILLAFMLEACGLTLGLVLSAYIQFEDTALQVSIGLLFPILFIGGVLWPLESLDSWLRTISHLTPITYPTEAIRAILLRGWGLADEPVYLGFVVTTVWIIIFLIIAGLGIHFKRF